MNELTRFAADAEHCQRCPLYKSATQTVFGEGPATAAIVMVGEQPGDQEDRAGRPFVGPAGGILDRALEEAGIERGSVYVTNAVKHFKFEQRGKRRLHKRPNSHEIERCRWWLDRELAVIEPTLVVALGVTAAQALSGRNFVLTRERGRGLRWSDGRLGLATIHPSAVLRMRDDVSRKEAFASLVADLRQGARLASAKTPA